MPVKKIWASHQLKSHRVVNDAIIGYVIIDKGIIVQNHNFKISNNLDGKFRFLFLKINQKTIKQIVKRTYSQYATSNIFCKQQHPIFLYNLCHNYENNTYNKGNSNKCDIIKFRNKDEGKMSKFENIYKEIDFWSQCALTKLLYPKLIESLRIVTCLIV